MGQQCLRDEFIGNTVEKILEGYRLWGKRYRMGFNTRSECYQRMETVFYENFWELIRENKLKLCLSEVNFPSFYKEFERFENGNISDNPDHIPWLYNVAQGKCEASVGDQQLFFDLMEKLHLAPDLFEPVPENIPSFDVDQIHQYFFEGIYRTKFNCVDDGGLLEDEQPIGKKFKLKNEQGISAVITIKKEKNDENREPNSRTPLEFKATGYIEGYTAIERTCNPEITLLIEKDRRLP